MKSAKDWGWREFITLQALFDADAGYLVNDDCIFAAEVLMLKESSEAHQVCFPSTIWLSTIIEDQGWFKLCPVTICCYRGVVVSTVGLSSAMHGLAASWSGNRHVRFKSSPQHTSLPEIGTMLMHHTMCSHVSI